MDASLSEVAHPHPSSLIAPRRGEIAKPLDPAVPPVLQDARATLELDKD